MLIDFHYHCADLPTAVDDLLADMDASGVERTLLMGGPPDAYWDYKQCGFASNERVAEAVRAHADRLLGNVYLDPREADCRRTLRRYLDLGFRAVKLFPPAGFDPGDERFFDSTGTSRPRAFPCSPTPGRRTSGSCRSVPASGRPRTRGADTP